MATQPIGRDASIVTLPGTLPPMPAVARILARFDRASLSAFIAVAIDLCDMMEGDSEAELSTWPEAIEARQRDEGLPEDNESAGDDEAGAWIEWNTMPASQKRGTNLTAGHEDDEDADPDTSVEDGPLGFDPEEDRCLAGDDGCGPVVTHGSIYWGSNWEDEGD